MCVYIYGIYIYVYIFTHVPYASTTSQNPPFLHVVEARVVLILAHIGTHRCSAPLRICTNIYTYCQVYAHMYIYIYTVYIYYYSYGKWMKMVH